MELLRQEVKERPTAERALKSLGEAVGLSRSTIARQLRSAPLASRAEKDTERRVEIHKVALEMRTYGYRPITAELHRRQQIINHKVVLRLLRADNLLCLRQRAFVATTDSDHHFKVYPNLARDLVFDRYQSTLGRRYHLHSPAPGVYLFGGFARCLQSPLHWLGVGTLSGCAPAAGSFADGSPNPLFPTWATNSSLGSRSAVCVQGIRASAPGK